PRRLQPGRASAHRRPDRPLRGAGVPRAPRHAGEPGHLVHHVCLRYSRQKAREEWAFVGAGGAPLAVSVDGPLAASSGTMLREAAVAGLGLAVLPESEIAEELAAGRLRVVLPGSLRDAALGVYAVHAHGRKAPARVRAFVESLVEWFRKTRW